MQMRRRAEWEESGGQVIRARDDTGRYRVFFLFFLSVDKESDLGGDTVTSDSWGSFDFLGIKRARFSGFEEYIVVRGIRLLCNNYGYSFIDIHAK